MRAYYFTRMRPWVLSAVLFAGIYFSIDLSLWLLARRLHIQSFPPEIGAMVERFHKTVLCGAAVVYALQRASGYHPAIRKGYRDWLRTTPWHPGMNLPLGPAMLALRDVVVVGLFVALGHWHTRISVLPVLLAFCWAFEFGSLMTLSSSYAWGAYGILFGSAFVLRWVQHPEIAAAFAGAMLIFTQYALHRSLAGFPWEPKPAELNRVKGEGSLAMIPPDTQPLVSTRSALAGSALVGVWLWCLLCLEGLLFPLTTFQATVLGVFLIALTGFGMLLRWTAYSSKYHCTLSLLGRIATGRLIVPGYDYAILAPATALPVAGLLPIWLATTGLPASVIISITAAACLAILMIAPPSMRVWQLTGTHRAVGFMAGQPRMRA